ncbi:GlsB/YeaQ/YmgE family stress response membrane protein [Thauera sp. Sel9]|uniref:GlsB/YeaQ/YmgE family stress response membrane protein n=1 Tax=Thauera sp. Sel9 TaxID=2974299 RepID=UPI0021E17132|nr:GlsB/YeaQ/YmgE family stress response membrane protein [Thauera sp. Sel9]MCV2219616.1 GlsB/YeaQ/YmgE family stress response membrane protein [Thauera sp. Sel9]
MSASAGSGRAMCIDFLPFPFWHRTTRLHNPDYTAIAVAAAAVAARDSTVSTDLEDVQMSDMGVGWLAAVIIGGIAGWIASGLMKSNTGVLMNIVLGIIGASVASFLFGILGVSFGGWLGYLVAGVVGACILIGIVRAVRK